MRYMLSIRSTLVNNDHTFRQLISLSLSDDLSTIRLNIFRIFLLICKVESRWLDLSSIFEHHLFVLLLQSGIAVRSVFQIRHLDIRSKSKICFSVLVVLDLWPLRGLCLTLLRVSIFCYYLLTFHSLLSKNYIIV